MSIPPSDDLDYKKMPLRLLMEKKCEPRIRHVQVKSKLNQLWITLWDEFSMLNIDIYRCLNQWIKNLNKALKSRHVRIQKVDFKVGSYGTFCDPNYKNLSIKLVRALNLACQRLNSLDHGFEDNLGEWNSDVSDPDLCYSAIKGFSNTQTFLSVNIINQRNIHYGWKRYDKPVELMQKATVGQSFGSRIDRLTSIHPPFGQNDPHFSNKVRYAEMTGITRDEIGVWHHTGLFARLDGRAFDIDDGLKFVSDIQKRLDTIRRPTLTKKILQASIWKIPITDLLTRFASLPRNVVVLGDRRINFAYAKHELKNYITGILTRNFKWDELVGHLEDAIKRHATIGANVTVYHHTHGYIGTVKKLRKQNVFW